MLNQQDLNEIRTVIREEFERILNQYLENLPTTVGAKRDARYGAIKPRKKYNEAYVKLHKTNTSGVNGVNYFKDRAKWQAKFISPDYEHLGFFDTFDEAVEARYNAEQAYHDSAIFNNSPAMQYMIKIGKFNSGIDNPLLDD